ncbi:Protein of unknown function [Modicisalibacter ilicicola DSM 19980]|uniref:Quinol:cytochrome c oxidoreductase membrane protein n=1 Tax=Modicisalibacter ilicicola DSM 19980 TaxID=1121942 RepID=A0A1M5CIC0_9GAMM|nr:DUF3341 domain-containing protein [Halomonas ilicicola]SHF54478.1 Protein of unknown function [Halomonas ilicicola DSM 19980]
MSNPDLYGVLGRFEHPDALLEAIAELRKAGHSRLEAFSPYPVEGLSRALGERSRWLTVAALVGALLTALATYGMIWYSAVIDYPYVVGGKPLHSWPPFLLLAFVLAILAAVLVALVGMLMGNRLPRLYHPAFNVAAFSRASDDGFFILIRLERNPEDVERLRRRLDDLHALDIQEVPA